MADEEFPPPIDEGPKQNLPGGVLQEGDKKTPVRIVDDLGNGRLIVRAEDGSFQHSVDASQVAWHAGDTDDFFQPVTQPESSLTPGVRHQIEVTDEPSSGRHEIEADDEPAQPQPDPASQPTAGRRRHPVFTSLAEMQPQATAPPKAEQDEEPIGELALGHRSSPVYKILGEMETESGLRYEIETDVLDRSKKKRKRPVHVRGIKQVPASDVTLYADASGDPDPALLEPAPTGEPEPAAEPSPTPSKPEGGIAGNLHKMLAALHGAYEHHGPEEHQARSDKAVAYLAEATSAHDYIARLEKLLAEAEADEPAPAPAEPKRPEMPRGKEHADDPLEALLKADQEGLTEEYHQRLAELIADLSSKGLPPAEHAAAIKDLLVKGGVVGGRTEKNLKSMVDPNNLIELQAQVREAVAGKKRELAGDPGSWGLSQAEAREIRAAMIKDYVQTGRPADSPREVPESVLAVIEAMLDMTPKELQLMLGKSALSSSVVERSSTTPTVKESDAGRIGENEKKFPLGQRMSVKVFRKGPAVIEDGWQVKDYRRARYNNLVDVKLVNPETGEEIWMLQESERMQPMPPENDDADKAQKDDKTKKDDADKKPPTDPDDDKKTPPGPSPELLEHFKNLDVGDKDDLETNPPKQSIRNTLKRVKRIFELMTETSDDHGLGKRVKSLRESIGSGPGRIHTSLDDTIERVIKSLESKEDRERRRALLSWGVGLFATAGSGYLNGAPAYLSKNGPTPGGAKIAEQLAKYGNKPGETPEPLVKGPENPAKPTDGQEIEGLRPGEMVAMRGYGAQFRIKEIRTGPMGNTIVELERQRATPRSVPEEPTIVSLEQLRASLRSPDGPWRWRTADETDPNFNP